MEAGVILLLLLLLLLMMMMLETHAVAYTFKAAVDRFECYNIIICKHFNICCFIAVAYGTLDRLRAVYLRYI